jgi:cell division protein ZapA
MSDINVIIGGKQYRMACEDGQEDRLRQLAQEFEGRITELRGRFGEIGDARLLVMAALMVSDELLDARRQIGRQADELRALQHDREILRLRAQTTQTAVADALNAASERLERMTTTLKSKPGGAGVPVG